MKNTYVVGVIVLAVILLVAAYLNNRSYKPVAPQPFQSSEAEYKTDSGTPYDLSKVTNPYNKDLNKSVGIVKNQVYIFSTTLKEQDLRAIVASYPTLTVLGYEPIGLLVQFDDMNPAALQDIESIRRMPGIVDIFNRVHQGKNYDGAL